MGELLEDARREGAFLKLDNGQEAFAYKFASLLSRGIVYSA